MRLFSLIAFLLAGVCAVSWLAVEARASNTQSPSAIQLNLTGVIDPPNARYVDRVFDEAEKAQAPFVLIRIDTPGGLDSSMRDIVKRILNSSVPSVAYVGPAGARAASAGMFIAASANVLGMAPTSNIGAAHPISGTGEDLPDTLSEKVTNDISAFARAIASQRNRNGEWLEKAVRESVSASAPEAVELGVADLLAHSIDDLLAQINGREVTQNGRTLTLETSGAAPDITDKNLLENVLSLIANPNVALLLMLLGVMGIIYEAFHPLTIWPGVGGVILIALTLVAFGSLPVNWFAFGLILLGFGLLAAELWVPGFGVVGGMGIVALVIGGFFLFAPFGAPDDVTIDRRVSIWVLAVVNAMILLLFLVVFQSAVDARKLKPVMGTTNLLGSRGFVSTALSPQGTVQCRSELWTAVSEDGSLIHEGSEVEVTAINGLTLTVRKLIAKPNEPRGDT